ncbi:MAG: hypothetical protein PHX87_03810 [Candidatus Peribacteraceae bacterium]|nr:hypothetical protein [Candidatus Peribacteraceae bacterium]MDD5742530.1 hypothetical protein [Candidatus Peribacteraceae bacterium]
MTYKHFLRGALLLLSLCVAPAALAYLSPEDVLLNKELYLPPTTRETMDRVAQQSRESADRREREQEIIFNAQHSSEASSVAAVPAPAEGNGAAPEGSYSAEDLRLLQTIRLLDRVQRNQQVVLYGDRMLPLQADSLHGGAPLAPTGAGGILSGITMAGAVGWTLWRAKKGKVMAAK